MKADALVPEKTAPKPLVPRAPRRTATLAAQVADLLSASLAFGQQRFQVIQQRRSALAMPDK